MIGIVRFWETVNQRAKTGTSGYDSQDEFNRKIAEVQSEAISKLSPFYSHNIQIQDILSLLVVTLAPQQTNSDGVLDKPTDYEQFISSSINGHPAWPINVNQKSIYRNSRIRKPSVEHNRYFYCFENNKISYLPEEQLSVEISYIRSPSPASIQFTNQETEDSDYRTVAAVTDLEWPESAFNLLLYLMLEKLGIEQKENLLIEYSQLGLQKESANI